MKFDDCNCCEKKDDVIVLINNIIKDNIYDHIILEANGTTEPINMAGFFTGEGLNEENPNFELYMEFIDLCSLNNIITVVNGSIFFEVLNSVQTINGTNVKDIQDKSICDLMYDQLEFSHQIYLHSNTLLHKECIKSINRDCSFIENINESLEKQFQNSEEAFDILFDKPCWLRAFNKENRKDIQFDFNKENLFIKSFVYKSRKPFHPERLYNLLNVFGKTCMNKESKNETFNHIIRSKGKVWLPNCNSFEMDWKSSGKIFSLEPGKMYLGSIPQDEWDEEAWEIYEEDLKDDWDIDVGDRMQELFFLSIGTTSNILEEIQKQLNNALLTEDEMNQDFTTFKDPFFGGQAVENFY